MARKIKQQPAITVPNIAPHVRIVLCRTLAASLDPGINAKAVDVRFSWDGVTQAAFAEDKSLVLPNRVSFDTACGSVPADFPVEPDLDLLDTGDFDDGTTAGIFGLSTEVRLSVAEAASRSGSFSFRRSVIA